MDVLPTIYEMVLEEHAEDAEYFLINAGEELYVGRGQGDAARSRINWRPSTELQ